MSKLNKYEEVKLPTFALKIIEALSPIIEEYGKDNKSRENIRAFIVSHINYITGVEAPSNKIGGLYCKSDNNTVYCEALRPAVENHKEDSLYTCNFFRPILDVSKEGRPLKCFECLEKSIKELK